MSDLASSRKALLGLGALNGAALTLARLGSDAYVLSRAKPIVALWSTVIAGLVFPVFYRWARLRPGKLSQFVATFTTLHGLVAAAIVALVPDGPFRAAAWTFLTSFGFLALRWSTDELTSRHLNPAFAKSGFLFNAISYEVGGLIALGFVRAFGFALSPSTFAAASMVLEVVSTALCVRTLVVDTSLEVKISRRPEAPKPEEIASYGRFFQVYLAALFCFGLVRANQEYATNFVVKESLVTYEAIRERITSFYFHGAFFTLALLAVGALVVERQRVSPVRLMQIAAGGIAIGVAFAFGVGGVVPFLTLDLLRRALEGGLFSPAGRMITGSLTGELRARLGTLSSVMGTSAPLVVSAVMLSLKSYFHWPLWILSVVLLAFLACTAFLVRVIERTLVPLCDELIAHRDKATAVYAADLLTFLRPTDFRERMEKILAVDAREVLRKTVILGLGYVRDEKSYERITKEFESDREEIQLAVLDAMLAARHFRAVQFLVNVVTTKKTSKSLRVRMSATTIVAAIYGKKGIPFLLNGLEDSDERVVANTLEVLAGFREPSLRSSFQRFIDHPTPRIRANAIIGLHGMAADREKVLGAAKDMLSSRDPGQVASILYAVGKSRLRELHMQALVILPSPLSWDPMVRRCLAWALTRLGDSRGYDLFSELFDQDAIPAASYMHFFAQLDASERFDVVRSIAIQRSMRPEALSRARSRLEVSQFDCHEEADYFDVVLDAIREQERRKSASAAA
jgi:hypothetical protein